MLYARCAFCGAIVPLYCSGRFMPHMPVPVVATPMGAACSTCGVLPPVFTCGFCWGQQLLYLPGASAAPQMGQNYAAVVQAQPGASDSALKGLFKEFGKGVGGELVKGLTQAVSGQQQY